MKHDWQHHDDPTKSPAQRFMSEPERCCVNCGAVQQRQTQYSWMRVTGYLWRPLVGRCKPAIQPSV